MGCSYSAGSVKDSKLQSAGTSFRIKRSKGGCRNGSQNSLDRPRDRSAGRNIRYISKDSEAYAATVITEILASVDNIAMFPQIGREVPEWNHENLREILVYKWRIIYRISADRIDIINIIHGAQRLRG